jgi:RimJ/RimL family protein N-acetyltransferase
LPEVSLRSPFPPEDVPRIWEWIEPFRWRVSDDYSPKTLMEFVLHFQATAARSKTWGVYRDGELGGCITYDQVSPIVGTAHVVFKKSFWGHATTFSALQLAMAECFESCQKLSQPVVSGNKAMISLLKKLGASTEGTLVAHSRRDGKPIDIVLLALFRPAVKED